MPSPSETEPSPSPVHWPPPPPPPGPGWRRALRWATVLLLLVSVATNIVLWNLNATLFSSHSGPSEYYHSGSKQSQDKLAIIEVSGTIMPPFTSRILRSIKQAKDDKHVKGILLQIDSPGGFVADSHQIYHRLKELAEKKPIIVSMGSLAASGGYYVAMGAGPNSRIFAEPTTWTGSIGVIIPRYELVGLKEKLGIDSKPLKTGEFKDALNPFSPLSEKEKAVWDHILDQAFDQFLTVIDEGREKLTKAQVKKLATGQIYTATDALEHGLIDEIGYEETAIEHLKQVASVKNPRVIKYEFSSGVLDLILGSQARVDPAAQWRELLEATVPRAMFYCSWAPAIPHIGK